MTRTLADRLRQLGLLAPGDAEGVADPPPPGLPALCDQGRLEGGLSVALDVRPDELLGPLTQRMGGRAAALKVLEVRDRDGVELTVSGSGRPPEVWVVQGTVDLVQALNQAFESDDSVRRVVVLGEWNDALQLWCLPSAKLEVLRREPWFQEADGSGMRTT